MTTTQYPNYIDQEVQKSFDIYSKEAVKKSAVAQFIEITDDDLYQMGFTAIEGITDVEKLGEEENLKKLEQKTSYKVIAESEEYAGEITTTKKELIRMGDNSVLLRKLVTKRTNMSILAMKRKIERQGHKFLNEGFSASAEFLAPDLRPIFALHEYQSSGNTFDNVSTTAAGESAIIDIEQYGGDFKDATGAEMPILFDTIIVKKGSTAERAFRQVFDKNIKPTKIADTNLYNLGQYTLIATPYITSDTAWFAKDSTFEEDPLKLGFSVRPQTEPRQTRPNLSEVTPTLASWKQVCAVLPVNLYGYAGT